MSGRSNILTEIIHNMGYKTKDFVDKFLGLNYNTYCYRVRNGQLKTEDIDRILDATGLTYEQIFRAERASSTVIRSEVVSSPVNLPEPKARMKGVREERKPNFVSQDEQKKDTEIFRLVDIDFVVP